MHVVAYPHAPMTVVQGKQKCPLTARVQTTVPPDPALNQILVVHPVAHSLC